MKKLNILNFYLFLLFLLLINSCQKDKEETVPIFEHDFGSFTDPRDGHVYKTIEIGAQIWFAENLAYEGTGQELITFQEWVSDSTYIGWCYYQNDKTTYGNTYGILYKWQVANVACPEGWHLPSKAEWETLNNYLGGKYESGGKLKEAGTSHWLSPNKGATNESGFTALPGGSRIVAQPLTFNAIGDYGHFWTTDSDSAFATSVSMASWTDMLFIPEFNFDHKNSGVSVRCLKD